MSPTPSIRRITASAGSGKTYALTGRFLALLREAARGPGREAPPACSRSGQGPFAWSEIMAVTFTNKAAAEMKARIVEHLKRRALGDTTGTTAADWPQATALAWLERILRRFDRLNVRTIDSLLSLLLSVFALELRLSPDFEAVFDVAEVFEELMDRVVARAETGDEAARAALVRAVDTLLVLDNAPGMDVTGRFRDKALDVLRHRLEHPGALFADPAELHRSVLALAEALGQAARAMEEAVAIESLDPMQLFSKFLAKCASDPTVLGNYSAFMLKSGLSECLKKRSPEPGPESRRLFEDLRLAHDAWYTDRPLFEKARGLAGMAALTDVLLDELAELQVERNILLKAYWEPLARHLLTEAAGAPEAFCRMGSRLRHLLVDEFQDTSRGQWEAMEPLAQECLSKAGSLTIVGDVKQAIYGWRGGDAALFGEVMRSPALTAMLDADPVTEPLEANWRSWRHVVEFNNRVFSRLGNAATARAVAGAMLGGDDAHAEAAAGALAGQMASAFADAAQQISPKTRDTAGYVRLTRLEAASVAELEARTRAETEALFRSLAARRPLRDLAVLVRSNDQAADVASWLIGLGLPVITENSLRLAEHAVVRQLVALLRFLDYPLDDPAFRHLVSGTEVFSHAGGPTRDELDAWLASRAGTPLYASFERDFPDSWARLEPFFRRAGLMSPYDCAREAVSLFRLLERHPDDELFIRRFLEVVHQAETRGCLSLSAFLDFWDRQGTEEKAPLPENADAVRIMTMHKAKGLEFEVVVVPFHHWSWQPRLELAVVERGGRRLLSPLGKHLGPDWWPAAAKASAEQLNLLYVAWTRPRAELYAMLPAQGWSVRGGGRRPVLAALDALLAEEDFRQEGHDRSVLEWGQPPKASDAPCEAVACPPRREPGPGPDAIGDPMSWLPRLKIRRRFHNMSRDDLLGLGGAFDERARGSVIHAAMDRLRPSGDPADDETAIVKAVDAALAAAQRLPEGEASVSVPARPGRRLSGMGTVRARPAPLAAPRPGRAAHPGRRLPRTPTRPAGAGRRPDHGHRIQDRPAGPGAHSPGPALPGAAGGHGSAPGGPAGRSGLPGPAH